MPDRALFYAKIAVVRCSYKSYLLRMGERNEGGPVVESVERNVEHAPTREEVVEVLRKLIDGEYKELRSREDAQGLYLLEVVIAGKNTGETIEYSYARKGSFPETKSTTTTISLTYFDADGMPEGGKTVADFVDGKWELK